jgi:hypothetical protein
MIKAMIESYIKEESAAFLAERGDEDPWMVARKRRTGRFGT